MEKIQFNESKHLLNHNEIDTLHKEFLDIYNSVNASDIQSYIEKLKELYEHSIIHFTYEEEQMDKYGYPTSKEHKDEHNKVLAEMQYFISKSNTMIGRKMLQAYYKEKLPDWFDLHLISMDSDLSGFLKSHKMLNNQ
jgi:hemerythrin-like metal-binding protein